MSRKKKILILMVILMEVYFITIEQWIFVGMIMITAIVALVVRMKPSISRGSGGGYSGGGYSGGGYSGGGYSGGGYDNDDDNDELDEEDYGTR
jgi:uncharacterized membrane protein YgcG